MNSCRRSRHSRPLHVVVDLFSREITVVSRSSGCPGSHIQAVYSYRRSRHFRSLHVVKFEPFRN